MKDPYVYKNTNVLINKLKRTKLQIFRNDNKGCPNKWQQKDLCTIKSGNGVSGRTVLGTIRP